MAVRLGERGEQAVPNYLEAVWLEGPSSEAALVGAQSRYPVHRSEFE